MRIYGNIMLHDEFFVGTVEIEDGKIEKIWKKKENYDVKGTVIPTFVNMHTHIGDYYYREEINMSLKDVVGPNGLKFKILEDEEKVKEGMKNAVEKMERCGTSHFVDFREGGERGVRILREILTGRKIKGVILGRGDLWDDADGVGLSSISDVDFIHAKNLAEKCKAHGKIFALHASEDGREDVEKILQLEPDFIVHFLDATEEDLEEVKEKGIPIVLTPRANMFWGKMPNIPLLLKKGITVALGTDNGMIAEPCMFREMEFAYRTSKLNGFVRAQQILKMATVEGRKILGIHDNYEGKKARLIVFNRIMNPYELVTRASCSDIKEIIM